MTEAENSPMDFGVVVARDLQVDCLLEQQEGIAASNECRIKGGSNKCPAGSTMTYAGERQTIDASILCPLDSVDQSEWIDASQRGLCSCESQLKDENCGIIEEEMDCECFACPFGMKLGFAYTCTTAIVGPCKSFDCFGNCNKKYDPGNLVGDKETFPPSEFGTTFSTEPSAGTMNNHVMGTTALMVTVVFRMIF